MSDTKLKRRPMNESQRAMVAATLETMKRGRPGKDADLHVKRPDAAKLLNVSPRSVAAASRIRNSGTPELVKAVESGKHGQAVKCGLISGAKNSNTVKKDVAGPKPLGPTNAAVKSPVLYRQLPALPARHRTTLPRAPQRIAGRQANGIERKSGVDMSGRRAQDVGMLKPMHHSECSLSMPRPTGGVLRRPGRSIGAEHPIGRGLLAW